MAQWQKTTCVADHKAEELLQKLSKKKEVLCMFTINWELCFFFRIAHLTETCFSFQEAQEKLLELDRLSNELDAFIEKSKNATVEESEVHSVVVIP